MKRFIALFLAVLLLCLCACTSAAKPDAISLPPKALSFVDLLTQPIEQLSGEDLTNGLAAGGWEHILADPGDFYAGNALGHAAQLTYTTDQNGMVSSIQLKTTLVTPDQMLEGRKGFETFDGKAAEAMASCLMQARKAMQAVGGTLTDGSRYFSGETESDILQVITDFFEDNPNTGAEFAEQYYLLPSGDYFGASAICSTNQSETVGFLCRLYTPNYQDTMGAQPQYSDYRSGNEAASYVDAPLTITTTSAAPAEENDIDAQSLTPETLENLLASRNWTCYPPPQGAEDEPYLGTLFGAKTKLVACSNDETGLVNRIGIHAFQCSPDNETTLNERLAALADGQWDDIRATQVWKGSAAEAMTTWAVAVRDALVKAGAVPSEENSTSLSILDAEDIQKNLEEDVAGLEQEGGMKAVLRETYLLPDGWSVEIVVNALAEKGSIDTVQFHLYLHDVTAV